MSARSITQLRDVLSAQVRFKRFFFGTHRGLSRGSHCSIPSFEIHRQCHRQGCGKPATTVGTGGAVRYWCEEHVHLDREIYGDHGEAIVNALVWQCVLVCLFLVLVCFFTASLARRAIDGPEQIDSKQPLFPQPHNGPSGIKIWWPTSPAQPLVPCSMRPSDTIPAPIPVDIVINTTFLNPRPPPNCHSA